MTIRVSKDRVDMEDKQVIKPYMMDYSETVVTADSSTSYTVDLTTGNVFNIAHTGNCTFTFSNPPSSGTAGSFTLILTQDTTANRSVIWPSAVKWPDAITPTLYTTAGAVNIFTFFTVDGGTLWYGKYHTGYTAYQANAVNFDGTNDYLTRGAGLTSAADGKAGLLSFWFNKIGSDGTQYNIIDSTGNAFTVIINTNDKLRIQAENVGGTVILQMLSNTTITTDGWHHVLASWNLATGTGQLYIDDISDIAASPTLTNDTIDYTVANWSIGAGTGGTNKFNGDLAEVFFTLGYLDISVAANRRFFVDPYSRPVDLRGLRTGAIVYLSGATSTWHTNQGYGGGFTENGAIGDGTTNPSTGGSFTPAQIDFITSQGYTANSNTYTLSSVVVPEDGVVVVGFVSRTTTASLSGVTVDGGAATLAFKQSGDQATVREIWYREYTAGTYDIIATVNTTVAIISYVPAVYSRYHISRTVA